MNTITKFAVYLIVSLTFANLQGQEVKKDSIPKSDNELKQVQIDKLKDLKQDIEKEERDFLKAEIEAINIKLDKDEISAEEAEELKQEAAKRRAANIENRLAIIDNKIALIERNEIDSYNLSEMSFTIGSNGIKIDLTEQEGKKSPPKYDVKTTGQTVFAIGFNNTLIDGQSIDDSPYKIGGSGFVEMGYAWKTRIFENTNFWRLKYGFSFQWNKLDIKDNNFFVNTDGDIALEEFSLDLKKAKFRTTNLVFPMHIEFGPSKKIEKKDHFRYSTNHQLKVGLGGFAGFNIGSIQKLKFKDENGNRIKDKQRGGFEVSEFVYGLSGYIALGDVPLYVKYDLNPVFKNQIIEQNNISVGLRFDMD
jgi:hypothetical protein